MAVRSIEEARAEAVKRLAVLKVHENVLREFLEEEKLNRSERLGILYWLNDEEQAMVKEFEEKHEAVVYHVIHQHTNIGEMYSLLYVSLEDGEWCIDREDLASGQALAYVINKTMPDCSEFGSIGVEPCNGGIVRTW